MAEINVFDSLDERDAVRNFLGKDREQARRLFVENFLTYQEDLMWMGPKAFAFYVPAAIDYLLSEESNRDTGAASSFCGLIEFRLDCSPAEMAPIAPIILEGIQGILERFDRFGFDLDGLAEICGDVGERYRVLRSRLESLPKP